MNKILIFLCGMMVVFGIVSTLQAETMEVNLLANGDFDAGSGFPWVEYSSQGWNLITDNDNLPPLVSPHSGTYVAWLGGEHDHTDYLYQDVAIPKGTAALTLNLFQWIDTEEPSPGSWDQVVVSLRNTEDTLLETLAVFTNEDSTSGWVEKSFLISGNYSGSTVRIHLSSSTDESYITNFFFDTVSLNATVKVVPNLSAIFLLLLQ